MAYTYEYPRPSLTVDCIIFGLDESSRLKVLFFRVVVLDIAFELTVELTSERAKPKQNRPCPCA